MFKIGIYSRHYFVRKCGMKDLYNYKCGENGPGVFPELLAPMIQWMNASYQLIPVDIDFGGTCTNGTWTPKAMFGQVQDGTLDTIADAYAFSNFERESGCLARSFPLFQLELAFFGRKYKPNLSSNFWLLIESFDFYIWFFLACFLLLYVILVLIRKRFPFLVNLKGMEAAMLFLSILNLLFTSVFSGILLTRLLGDPAIYFKDDWHMISMIENGKVKLALCKIKWDSIETLEMYKGNTVIKKLLSVVKKNPSVAVEVEGRNEFYEMLASGEYVGFGYAFERRLFEMKANCTVDIITSTVDRPKVQNFFIFNKKSKWLDKFNKALVVFQERAHQARQKYQQMHWFARGYKCSELEKIQSASSKNHPLSAKSLLSAFLALGALSLTTLPFLIHERLKTEQKPSIHEGLENIFQLISTIARSLMCQGNGNRTFEKQIIEARNEANDVLRKIESNFRQHQGKSKAMALREFRAWLSTFESQQKSKDSMIYEFDSIGAPPKYSRITSV